MNNLFAANTLSSFWRLLPEVPQTAWMDATRKASVCQPDRSSIFESANWAGLMVNVLGEGQFGRDHWQLSRVKQAYYRFVRPLLPDFMRPLLRSLIMQRQKAGSTLRWPVEDRYVRFIFCVIAELLAQKQFDTFRYIHFWPAGKRFAFVLTHDVETSIGQSFIKDVARLDEEYGFRSSFNFIPEKYSVDVQLIEELKERGFEVGVHGLKHDGRLFLSKAIFDTRVKKINRYIEEWGAAGFRSPMTHRNPEWMQELEIEYDSSFFDTDPYEPVPGGTMSIWPFQMGRFIELPYTLAQDHTLMNTLGETTPRLWLEKVAFIRKYCGMALVNTHPDYLSNPSYFPIYKEFLRQMKQWQDYWHALPREVARWWKKRSGLNLSAVEAGLNTFLPGATIGTIRRLEEEIKLDI